MKYNFEDVYIHTRDGKELCYGVIRPSGLALTPSIHNSVPTALEAKASGLWHITHLQSGRAITTLGVPIRGAEDLAKLLEATGIDFNLKVKISPKTNQVQFPKQWLPKLARVKQILNMAYHNKL